jgi:hypothetical protein
MRHQIDEQKFAKQVAKVEMYEGTFKDFVFIAPKSKQDFLDEATSQSNCLAGYINLFIDGNCLILFMRHKSTPDKSFVTVEIDNNGDVVQAKLARNVEPSMAVKSILYEWILKCNKKAEKNESEPDVQAEIA